MPSAGLDVFVASDPSHIPRINRQILTADPFLPLSPQTLTISKLWFGDQLWSVAGMNCQIEAWAIDSKPDDPQFPGDSTTP